MILDTLDNWRHCAALSPGFARAFTFLHQVTDETPVGRCEIAGEDVFAIVQRHDTQPLTGRHYEAHRKYVDVQYMHRGQEVIHWAPLSLLTNVVMPYDQANDAALYGLIPGSVPIALNPGCFAILLPTDGHIPSCAFEQPAEVFKVVVKVRVA